jgi:hypothetical protein
MQVKPGAEVGEDRARIAAERLYQEKPQIV